MKIKTIKKRLDNADKFDAEVNEAIAEGYQLVQRSIVPGFRLDGGDYLHNMLFAELVLPNPVPEPEQGDPVEALRCIRDFCKAMPLEKCLTPECPLFSWCHVFTEDGVSPSDWPIPGEEAGR